MAHTYGGAGRLPSTGTVVSTNPVTVSLNLPAGTTVLVVSIGIQGTTARAGGNPTFNSVSLTSGIAKTNAGGTPEEALETWYMLDPPTGTSYTLSIPNTGTLSLAIQYAYASAANGFTSVLDTTVNTPGNSTNPSTSMTVTDGSIWFAAVGNGAQTWAPSAWSGTKITDWDCGAWGRGMQYGIKSGTGSQTMSWTFGTSEDWIIQGISFKEQVAATNVALTNVSATGNVTAPSVSVDRALSTVNATGQVGTLTPSLETSVAITTVSATGQTGTLTPSVSYDVAITTVAATGQTGSLGKTLDRSISTVSATGQTGTLTPALETSVAITTVSSTGATGSLGKTLDRALTTAAATGQVGSLGKTLDVAITTVSTTGQTGTLTPSQATTAALTTVSATGATGSLGKTHTVALTTVAATGQTGTLTPSLATIADLSGVSATGQTGNLGKTLDRAATTVYGTGQTGTLTPSVSTTVALTSASATGAVGSITASKSGETFTIALSGNQVIGYLGTLATSGGDAAAPRYYGGGKDVDPDIIEKQWELLEIKRRAVERAEAKKEHRQDRPSLTIAPPQAAAVMAEPALMSDEEIIKLVVMLDALE